MNSKQETFYRNRIALLELALMTWEVTFSKYESWQANKVAAKYWPKQVLTDYEKLSKTTKLIDI